MNHEFFWAHFCAPKPNRCQSKKCSGHSPDFLINKGVWLCPIFEFDKPTYKPFISNDWIGSIWRVGFNILKSMDFGNLIVCYYHVMYVFQSESTLYIKEPLAQNRYDTWNLSESNRIWTQNHLVCKWSLIHLAKLAKWLNSVVFDWGEFKEPKSFCISKILMKMGYSFVRRF